MAGRKIISDQWFDREVERLGGFEKLDPILAPIIESLYSNPYVYPTIQNDWVRLCRYAATKPAHGQPGFIVAFTIETDGAVTLHDIFEKEEF
jgi:hypothetical protein